MSAFLAYLGTFLLSLFVALLAALQLADYFAAGEEFALVLIALPVFVAVSMLAFAIASATARQPVVFNALASCLALLAFAPLAIPLLMKTPATPPQGPFAMAMDNTTVALQFIVPSLSAVLAQWGLVRRRWLRQRGEEDLSLWPWVATVIGGLAILNPYGLDVIGQAITFSQTNWLRDLVRTVALGGAAALLLLVFVETYVRSRMLRRRLEQPG